MLQLLGLTLKLGPNSLWSGRASNSSHGRPSSRPGQDKQISNGKPGATPTHAKCYSGDVAARALQPDGRSIDRCLAVYRCLRVHLRRWRLSGVGERSGAKQRDALSPVLTDYYLTPNEARNLATEQVRTRYVVFIDNDVVVAPGMARQSLMCRRLTPTSLRR